jgi:hypothetical protein
VPALDIRHYVANETSSLNDGALVLSEGDPLGWQPSRFLEDRGEAERAFALAKRLGSVNAAAQALAPPGRRWHGHSVLFGDAPEPAAGQTVTR